MNKVLLTRVLLLAPLFAVLLDACTTEESPTGATFMDEALIDQLEREAPIGEGMDYFLLPESNDFANIPQDPNNPITAFKVQLGQMLFHETGIGRDPIDPNSEQTYSCASCHHAAGGFQACLPQGIGEGGVGFGVHGEGRVINNTYALTDIDVQPIRTPSAMNMAYQEVVLWNGQFGATGLNIGTEANWTAGTPKENNLLGFQGVETQALAGINVHRLVVDDVWVNSMPQYKAMFDAAFPAVPQAERYSRITAALAIAAYERTLLANQSPWQRWLRGNPGAMSDLEKEGALLFFGKAGCSDCHTGPALSSMEFHAYGFNNLVSGQPGVINSDDSKAENLGRGGFTGRNEDMYKFKVPQLYNLSDSPFYGHGASHESIRSVVEYKNNGVPENPLVPVNQLALQFVPLNLSEGEVQALTAFLEESLHDPNLQRYVPGNLPTGLCFPNNDPQAQIDQGCQ